MGDAEGVVDEPEMIPYANRWLLVAKELPRFALAIPLAPPGPKDVTRRYPVGQLEMFAKT